MLSYMEESNQVAADLVAEKAGLCSVWSGKDWPGQGHGW